MDQQLERRAWERSELERSERVIAALATYEERIKDLKDDTQELKTTIRTDLALTSELRALWQRSADRLDAHIATVATNTALYTDSIQRLSLRIDHIEKDMSNSVEEIRKELKGKLTTAAVFGGWQFALQVIGLAGVITALLKSFHAF